MISVFLSGSRAISRLNAEIRGQLDNLIARRCKILIGDANGADKAMQQHFADRQYRNLVVFCMDHPRNNIGGWEVHRVSTQRKSKDSEYYAQKDRAMSQEAGCSLMLWDGASKGTLQNIVNQLEGRKTALVYFAPKKKFSRLTNEADLESLLAQCEAGTIDRFRALLQPRLHSLG